MSKYPELLLATENKAKIRELSQLLEGIPFRILSPDTKGIKLSVEETGRSMEENARLKATDYARASGLISIADDSGLEVDALSGEPGIRSRRYAGENASDEERISFILKKMVDIPWEKRSARFRCVLSIATPAGQVSICEGICEGYITFTPQGSGGFGYDPIFFIPEIDKTMAELPAEIKNQVSHRAKAAGKARLILNDIRETIFS
ncbi:MAG: XTP/dITP diphosphatase [Dehalococcoidia bacterium]|nr:XTP/dITP diphosphatase [Dehalococcoidia bacterium]MDZ4246903.1 XTP/dITP diphosphatase [Dehalococcoidia bacterium]